MQIQALDDRPRFWRRFIVTPMVGQVVSEVEDDYHRMRVTIQHDGTIATSVKGEMIRAPWTTCPGAPVQLEKTFTGMALDAFAARGEKSANCTHLHDLAVLAAVHAHDKAPLTYDVVVSDPIEGRREAELRRNGATLMTWTLEGINVVAPAEIAGLSLFKLGAWIETLSSDMQEAARIFRWGSLIANGRTIPLEQQSDATRMPPNCYTFQPEMARKATRVGVVKDFSKGTERPLDGRIAAV
jgi:hypothetical protein